MRNINIIKLICISLVIILLLILIVTSVTNNSKLTITSNNTSNDKSNIHNPVFISKDKKGRKFCLSASFAKQLDDLNNILLSNIKGYLEMHGSKVELISANEALYNSDLKIIDMKGSVKLCMGKKYEITTDNVTIFYEQDKLVGNSLVNLSNSKMNLKSDIFKITDKGNLIEFDGNIELKLY